MRQYRGKRKDNGEWVYGWYVNIFDTHLIIDEWSNFCRDAEIDGVKENNVISEAVEVIPFTVSHYTGESYNKQDIYGGDQFRGKESGRIYTVVYKDSQYWVVYDSKNPPGVKNLSHSLHYAICNSDLEYIGSIQDNPELLKG